ncbi:uncharacterized protein LOC117580380 [Drosophila guanche]|uniref:Blast:Nucleoprotein TPR n=1 Tax=Drosophila guanche TaxID=7266 RepID=A0A3B0J7D1_DROGU|nr:uncharacterized protein LOC117580380 [Drosophila guanche]SPP76033.1 blast:Nucleoprotein TPR [Drosophila guanche]
MVQKAYLVLHLLLVAGHLQPRETKVLTKEGSSQKAISRSLTQSQKFEQCIKIVAICHLIWDSPPEYDYIEYEDNDEDINEETLGPEETYVSIKEDYKKAKCIPPGLSQKDLAKFWEAVAEWETEVKNLFLVEKFVPIVKEFDNAIKINLWGVLRLRKTIMCYRSMFSNPKPPQTTTITTTGRSTQLTTTSTAISSTTVSPLTVSSCNAYTEIGVWIYEQINGTLSLDKLIKKLPRIVGKLERHVRRSCCPYQPVRDRVEVVHDGIDFILEFHRIEPYKRAQSSGFIGADIDNLKTRLKYLSSVLAEGGKGEKPSVGTCCPAWSEQLESFEKEFEKLVEKLRGNTFSLDITGLTNKQKDLERSHSGQIKLFEKLEALHNSQASEVTESCCQKEKIVENIEKCLEDLKSVNALSESTKVLGSLQERLNQTSETLKSTERLLMAEEANIRKITYLCRELCPTQKKQRLGQQSTSVRLLEAQVNEMNDKAPGIVDLAGSLNWAAHLKSINQVRQRFIGFMIEQRQKDVNFHVANIYEEPSDESLKELNRRLDQLEAKLKGLRPKNQTYEQILLDRMGGLEQRLGDRLSVLNARIKKTEADAKNCNSDCDWGELPTMSELQQRVKAMAASVKSSSGKRS